jgi:hypothetical protein
MTTQIKKLWPTDVLFGQSNAHESFDKLTNLILENSDNIFNENPSNVNIFDDVKYDFFLNNVVYSAFDQWLIEVLNSPLDNFKNHKIKGWISSTLGGMPLHNHSGAQLSAIFYLLVDDKDKKGETVLFDPRFNANRCYDNKWSDYFKPLYVKPSVYNFLVFPSFVFHQVMSSKSDIRLALAVDLLL